MSDAADDSSAPPQKTPSVECNFRQLDDAFLQTQAIIWLGEVLEIHFDQQMNISDLLADGELLCELSEVISKMIPALSKDDSQLRAHDWKSLASNKSTRRYLPYYNVDSFLRMCKNLGMDGIDLFTPSDVVERRNTRKVCMCLRALSKKVKSKDLIVPDFDSVTCTLAMPTVKVEYIRKSLERSQSSSSMSAEQEVEKISRVRMWQRMSNSGSALSNHDSDCSDEAESHFVVAESNGSSDYPYNAESVNILGSQVVKNEDDNLTVSNAESIGSQCSGNYRNEDFSFPSSDFQGSRVSGNIPELYDDTNLVYKNGDLDHIPIDWGDSFLDAGTYKDVLGNDDEVASVSHDKEDTDTACSNCSHPIESDMCNGNLETLNDLSEADSDKNFELGELPESAQNDDFHGGHTKKLSYEESFVCEEGPDVGKSHPDEKFSEKDLSSESLNQSSNVSELENLSNESENISCKVCTVVDEIESCRERLFHGNVCVEDANDQLGFYEQQASCSEDDDAQNRICSELLVVKSNANDNAWNPVRIVDQSRTSIPLLLDLDTIISGDVPNYDKETTGVNTSSANHSNQHSDKGLTDGSIINVLDIRSTDLNSSSDVELAKNTMECSKDCDGDLESSNGHNSLLESFNGKPMDSDDSVLKAAQSPKNVENSSHKNLVADKEVEKGQAGAPKQEGTGKELSIPKPQRNLLKSVVKGTAIVGVAVFLVRLRNILRMSRSNAKKQSIRLLKHVLECFNGQINLESGAHLVRDFMYGVAARCSSKLVRDLMY